MISDQGLTPTDVTRCAGTWLATPPDAAEQARIETARRALNPYRHEAEALAQDYEALIQFSLTIFRDPRFEPLHLSERIIVQIIEELGEPPVVERDDDPAFSDYLRTGVDLISTGRIRRLFTEQLRRFLPAYVEAGQIQEALALEHNAYLTVMSDAATPLLVQMTVAGLARYYDDRELDDEE